MKKTFVITFATLSLLLASIYLYIPNKIIIQKSAIIRAPESAVYNYLSPKKEWKKWWPQKTNYKIVESGVLTCSYKDVNFKIKQRDYYTIDIESDFDGFTSNGTITFFPGNANSTRVSWRAIASTSINPIVKIGQDREVRKTRTSIHEILNHLKVYLEDERNLYGITIQRTKVQDTLVLTTKITTPNPPSEKAVYNLINNLKTYINASKARETRFPILNITKLSSGEYQTMVGIPVDKYLENKGTMTTKRMVYNGYLLLTEVKGGRNTINYALRGLESYIRDKKLSSPAIPFESLVTNRIAQPDTTKWITRIYYPVY